MAVTNEQVERIRTLAPGWRSDFDELFRDIWHRVVNELPIGQYMRRYCLNPYSSSSRNPQGGDLDDFQAYLYEYYYRKADRRNLFPPYYDAGRLEPEVFLATARRILKKVEDYSYELRGRRPLRHLVDGPGAEDDSLGDPALASPMGFTAEDVLGQVLLSLEQAPMTRPAQCAAIQLFPWLDLNRSVLVGAKKYLESLSPPPLVVESKPAPQEAGQEPLAWLQRLHEKLRRSFEAQIDAIESELATRNVGPKRRRRLETRKVEKLFLALFCPLDALTIMEFMQVSRANADQILARYREWLREAFGGWVLPEEWFREDAE